MMWATSWGTMWQRASSSITPGVGRRRLFAAGIQPSAVLQLASRIVAKEVRRADRTVGLRHLLRRIQQIGEGEVLLGRNALHVFERVFRIIGRVVSHNGDRIDAERSEFGCIAHDAIDDRLDVWTVIADEHHQQAPWAPAVLQRPGPAVDAGQAEGRRRRAEIADRCFGTYHDRKANLSKRKAVYRLRAAFALRFEGGILLEMY